MPTETAIRFYIATCVHCKPLLDQPFHSEAERDAWTDEHAKTGHGIVTWSTYVAPPPPPTATAALSKGTTCPLCGHVESVILPVDDAKTAAVARGLGLSSDALLNVHASQLQDRLEAATRRHLESHNVVEWATAIAELQHQVIAWRTALQTVLE